MSLPVNPEEKKKGKSFSLTAKETKDIDQRAKRHHGFRNRSEYLLALLEMDQHYGLVRDVETLRLPEEPSEIEREIEMRRDEYQEGTDRPLAVAEEPTVPPDVPGAIAAEEQRKRAARGGGATRRGSGRGRGPKT